MLLKTKEDMTPYPVMQSGKGCDSLIFTAFHMWAHSLLLKEQKGAELKKKKPH